MKTLTSFFLLSFVFCLPGCGGPGTADVQGKPALKGNSDPKKNGSKMGGMKGNPNQMMLNSFDKNRDGKITKDEFPDGGLDGYDFDGDGVVTKEEIAKRNKEISKGGLGLLAKENESKDKIKKETKTEKK